MRNRGIRTVKTLVIQGRRQMMWDCTMAGRTEKEKIGETIMAE